jgi:hypothetical protein
MSKPKIRRGYEKMYECSACTSVFTLVQYRRPESYPCLNEPLHCPYCMVGGSLIRLHKSLPDRPTMRKQPAGQGPGLLKVR